MEHPVTSLGLIIVLAHYLTACSTQESSSNRHGSKMLGGGSTLTSCARVGPLSCEVPPFQDRSTEACAHLRSCIEGRRFGDQLVEQLLACDTPVLSATSDLGMAAAVSTQLNVGGPPSHGAYLFVHLQGGWCPADILLEPTWNHGGYCESDYELRWESGRVDSGVELHVISERICHMPLDQEEIAAGESDIAMSECRHIRYGISGTLLTKISEFETEGSCKSR